MQGNSDGIQLSWSELLSAATVWCSVPPSACLGEGKPSEVHLDLPGCGKEMFCKVISALKLVGQITAAFQRRGDSTFVSPFQPFLHT